MRSSILLAGCTLLAACDSSAMDAVAGEKTIAQMLRETDPQVCAEDEVQATVVRMFADNLFAKDLYAEFLKLGGEIEFQAANATATNGDIGEVNCSANLQLNGGSYPLQWKVRPALEGGEFIVEVPQQSSSNLFQRIVWEMEAQVSAKGGRTDEEVQPIDAGSSDDTAETAQEGAGSISEADSNIAAAVTKAEFPEEPLELPAPAPEAALANGI